jgi:hypothetical protein
MFALIVIYSIKELVGAFEIKALLIKLAKPFSCNIPLKCYLYLR